MNQANRLIKLRKSWFKYFRKTGNVAKTCRHFGISRNTFYFWRKRYQSAGGGVRGLKNLSFRPKKINSIAAHVIKAVIKLRRERFIGPKKIADVLAQNDINISHITVYRILKKFKINRLSKIS